MRERLPELPLLLEIGLLITAVLLAAGGIALLLGRVAGEAKRTQQQHEHLPSPGSVGPERHRNTGAVSTR